MLNIKYERDLYWDKYQFDPDKLEHKNNHNKVNDRVESNDLVTNSHVSDALRFAIFDFRRVNPFSPDISPRPNSPPKLKNQQEQVAVISD